MQLRIEKLELLFEKYDDVQLRLECLSDDPVSQTTERDEFERLYYKNLSKARDLLKRFSEDIAEESDKGSRHSSCNNNRFVKLPTIQLPKFSGSYDNWLEFHDSFVSLIHSATNIDDINKFHYLRASLEGTAAVVIQSIEFSAQNYKVAWELLCERFDNKRLLIQNHVSAIFSMDSISKESSFSIKRIIDQLNKNLRALESLGEETKSWDILLIHIVTQKLDNKTFREWEEYKGRLDKRQFIKLEIFLKFLQSRADLLETIELNRNQPLHQSTKLKSMVSVTTSQSQISKPAVRCCPKCDGNHPLYECSQFLSLSNEKRLKLLPNYKLCYNCFRSGHYANRCQRPGCKVCKRKHNTLVHVSKLQLNSINNQSSMRLIEGAEQSNSVQENNNNNVSLCISLRYVILWSRCTTVNSFN